MKPIRTFIAVPVPEAVCAHLGECALRMAPAFAPGVVRWVGAGSTHLTLRFLGDTDPAQVPVLGAALRQVAGGHAPFVLQLAGTGAFPGPRRPRVIWASVADPQQRLAALQLHVEGLVCAAGWVPQRRPFAPHLTLGRIREGAVPLAHAWLQDVEPLAVPVCRIQLIESRLHSGGATYQTLDAAALGGV
jgi:RNA 2',3'-cyclic 3'-phosphodiesterase